MGTLLFGRCHESRSFKAGARRAVKALRQCQAPSERITGSKLWADTIESNPQLRRLSFSAMQRKTSLSLASLIDWDEGNLFFCDPINLLLEMEALKGETFYTKPSCVRSPPSVRSFVLPSQLKVVIHFEDGKICRSIFPTSCFNKEGTVLICWLKKKGLLINQHIKWGRCCTFVIEEGWNLLQFFFLSS